ncbi:MAG TPA: hypothetical protein VFE05_00720 [Longimicrobiaceae bacterium]|jgi:hypothetical protein|nr:hypothetical protein [Longimicrobiaceae bacterium]
MAALLQQPARQPVANPVTPLLLKNANRLHLAFVVPFPVSTRDGLRPGGFRRAAAALTSSAAARAALVRHP